MTEAEYREFMSFLFESHIRPRLRRVRNDHKHHFEDEFSYQLDRAVRSARILRFVETYCQDDEEAYRTFTLERLKRAVSETRYSLEFSNRVADEAGFLEACESHPQEIADGLAVDYLPDADKEVLREIGSVNPDAELRSLVYRAKSWLERRERQSRDMSIRQELRVAQERLAKADAEFEKNVEASTKDLPEQSEKKISKKSRRWFKGLGQISQGAALSIADIGLAIGVLKLPVSLETQTWGAIASVATGMGTIFSGIGDLRNE